MYLTWYPTSNTCIWRVIPRETHESESDVSLHVSFLHMMCYPTWNSCILRVIPREIPVSDVVAFFKYMFMTCYPMWITYISRVIPCQKFAFAVLSHVKYMYLTRCTNWNTCISLVILYEIPASDSFRNKIHVSSWEKSNLSNTIFNFWSDHEEWYLRSKISRRLVLNVITGETMQIGGYIEVPCFLCNLASNGTTW